MLNILKKSLKKTFTTLFGFQFVLIIGLGVLVLFLYINQNNLAKSRDMHFNSYLLADQLRQSSDDLTRFARAYVATGDPKFESYYWKILDIRNGKTPRPLNYDGIYWDFIAGGEQERSDGEAISLHDLMVKEGFTNTEFEKLSLAQKNSDGLVRTEMIAMNAVKGLFDDGSGNFTIKKEPDLKLANELMNNQDYYKMKAEIMRPIDDFYKMFEERTSSAVTKYLQIANILFWIIILAIIFILIISFYSFRKVKQQILEQENVENELRNLPSVLEKKVQERTVELEQSKNSLEKLLEESKRLNRLMVGRELEMIELKKEISELRNK